MLFDVAIVAAVLAAQGVFRAEELGGTVLLGELGLDGRLRPIRGILPATLAAQQAGFTRVIVPLRQAGEANLVEGIEVFGVASITQLVASLRGVPMPQVDPIEVIAERDGRHANRRLDLADVVGQVEAKWACEVAAAGRHHLLFHGPPGVGKTMLAERVPGLLPDLDLHDALEVSAVHSLAGFNLADELITRPPYSDPHHSASVASRDYRLATEIGSRGCLFPAREVKRRCPSRGLLASMSTELGQYRGDMAISGPNREH